MGYARRLYHKIERIVDWLIFPAIIALLFVIIVELFFHDFAEHYHTAILVTDYIILSIFVLDLGFKFRRAKTIKGFLRHNWLDILAVFPIFVILRVLEPLILLTDFSKEAKTLQLIFHESLEISKGTTNLAKEAEALGKVSRARYITGIFRALGRSPRLLKGVAFYERPGKKPLKKQYKKVKKLEKKVEKKTFNLVKFKNLFKKK